MIRKRFSFNYLLKILRTKKMPWYLKHSAGVPPHWSYSRPSLKPDIQTIVNLDLFIMLLLSQDFDKKQQVRIHERPVVSNMFTLPTANQSWRKVLSMGNLLNGHEPVVREIIFSIRDRVSDHYAAHIPSVYQQEIETYRMYTCGTSNDLRVALSVVSCD